MKLIGLQVGMPKKLGHADATDPMEKEWESGFYKLPVAESLFASHTGLAGDGQADLKNHGGCRQSDQRLSAGTFLLLERRAQLGLCQPGAFGENFTAQGLTEEEVFIGDVFQIGGITVQVTQPRQPCWKLARRWRVKNLAALVQETGRTGWYFRVLTEGKVKAGEEFKLIERPHQEWSITKANDIMHHFKKDEKAAFQLGSCPALSESWKITLLTRANQLKAR